MEQSIHFRILLRGQGLLLLGPAVHLGDLSPQADHLAVQLLLHGLQLADMMPVHSLLIGRAQPAINQSVDVC